MYWITSFLFEVLFCLYENWIVFMYWTSFKCPNKYIVIKWSAIQSYSFTFSVYYQPNTRSSIQYHELTNHKSWNGWTHIIPFSLNSFLKQSCRLKFNVWWKSNIRKIKSVINRIHLIRSLLFGSISQKMQSRSYWL